MTQLDTDALTDEELELLAEADAMTPHLGPVEGTIAYKRHIAAETKKMKAEFAQRAADDEVQHKKDMAALQARIDEAKRMTADMQTTRTISDAALAAGVPRHFVSAATALLKSRASIDEAENVTVDGRPLESFMPRWLTSPEGKPFAGAAKPVQSEPSANSFSRVAAVMRDDPNALRVLLAGWKKPEGSQ